MIKILYKTLIRPNLEYANSIWSPINQKDIQRIEKVQRRATKLVRSLRHMSYEDRLRKLDLPTLAYRRRRGDLIQVYKIMNGTNDIQRNTLFEMASTNIGTRGHSLKIQKQHSRLRLREHSFTNRVVNSWNSLPAK
jgi:ribonuclease P/MRP protein subunit RPP40